MKYLVSVSLLLTSFFDAAGQFGNEWIRFNAPYFKIQVAQKGLYRISRADLQNAGLQGAPDPRTFQLYHRGTECALKVAGEADGQFDDGDFIEFYGVNNDGTLDAGLYPETSHQPHRHVNLFSDTTSYFLTYGQETGKRATMFSGPAGSMTSESFHWCEKIVVLQNNFSFGRDHGSVHLTSFDEGEGWMSNPVFHGQQATYQVPDVRDGVMAAGKPVLEILLTGRGPMAHEVELLAGTRSLGTVTFHGYQSLLHPVTLEWSDIPSDGVVHVTVRVPGAQGPDRVSTGYIRMVFPQRIAMTQSEKFFGLHENPSGVSLIEIENALPQTNLVDVTDPSAPVYLGAELGTTLKAVVPGTSLKRNIFATAVFRSPAVRAVSFREIHPDRHNYVIITHPLLRRPSMGYLDPVKAYAAYRALPAGGGYDTLVVNIGQLYDQFNYGERSPRAVYQFMKYLASARMPRYLFLIGKGLDVNSNYGRNPGAFTSYQDLVPAAGIPGSDMTFTAGLGGTANVPAVATGRLTAMRPAEVASYLNKVMELEAKPFDNLTRKKILHLSGGIEAGEPKIFRQIMEGFQAKAEDRYLGAQVTAIAKKSTDIKVVNIAEEVNQGVALITFFGHSAPNTQDFDIGRVTDPVMGYNNKGKYPVLLMNGCDAGAFFLNTSIFGENWINTPDRGAVGFIAHSSYGLVSSLQRYTSIFYDVAFADSVFIRKGVGEVQNEVAARYIANFGDDAYSVSQVQQMVLLGDPALRLFGAGKPDYEIRDQSVFVSSFDGERITAKTDSFKLNIPVRNFGIVKGVKLRMEVVRTINDDTRVSYDTIINEVLYSDTISVVIRNTDQHGHGNNNFSILVDADHFIDEMNETNNGASFDYFIPLNSTRNLYPYNFSIVRTREPELSFQYTDLQSDERSFILELDTVPGFNSGFRQQFEITAKVLGKQAVVLPPLDSTVYYWRTRIAQPVGSESAGWSTHSFSYIREGPEGWAQMRFPQYEANGTTGLVKDTRLERLKFEETTSTVALRTFAAVAGKPRDSVSVRINGAEFNILNEGGACRNNTINLIAFDRKSTSPYEGLYFTWYELLYDYGGRRLLCGREPYVINSFTPAEMYTGNGDDVVQYVNNIEAGDSVVLFTIGDAGFSQWPAEARTAMAQLGISESQLTLLRDGDAVAIFGRKGSAPGTAALHQSSSAVDPLRVSRTVSGRFTTGVMQSALIGPAARWDKLLVHRREQEPQDQVSVAILGIRPDGVQDTLRTGITASEDLSFIAASEYPQLKLLYFATDDINLTPAQLRSWIVSFEPVPEGLVLYNGPVDTQVLQEGQILWADFGFLNISDKTFPDSLSVRYNTVNPGALPLSPVWMNIAAPAPGDTTKFRIPFHTLGRGGLNDLEIFVNPRIFHEQFYDNNVLLLSGHLQVLTDLLPPVMTVTFDGRQISNYEFVRASPAIDIRVWDENRHLLKADTLGVSIFLAAACDGDACDYERIYFSRDDVSWDAATPVSDFKVRFAPARLAPGHYSLRVEARDAKGNLAGDRPYEIMFVVTDEQFFSFDKPYPNPFHFAASFDVSVAGPDEGAYTCMLRITNMNGQTVQEFREPTPLHVGINTLTWEARDTGGNSLPNGVYFYRMSIMAGQREEHFFGKLVLMR